MPGPVNAAIGGRSAKTVLLPAAPSRTPRPLPFPEMSGAELVRHHSNTVGALPEIGFYCIEDCFISTDGYVFDARTKHLYDAEDIDHPWWRAELNAKINAAGCNDAYSYFHLGGALETKAVRTGNRIYIRLVNPRYSVYGHWLLDLLPAAWFFLDNNGHDGHAVVFVIADDTPEWALDMTRLIFSNHDISFTRYRPSRETLQFDRLYVPSNLRVSPIMSNAFDGFVSMAQSAAQPSRKSLPSTKRILISRANSSYHATRRVDGWNDIEAAFARRGFVSIRPESMSWSDQIAAFSDAEFVAGEFGSGIHTSLFSRPDTKILAMAHTHVNQNQSAISATRQHVLQYLPAARENDLNGVFTYGYDMGRVEECLDAMLALPS